jgi:hypothetical protein
MSAMTFQTRILYSAALNFLPKLKLHHIVLLSNTDNSKIYAFDFTPINQTSFSTLSKLFFGYNVPAEIRVVYLEDSHFFDNDEILFQKWVKNKDIVSNKNIKIDEWNNDMNLYTHNCQHFSKWITTSDNQIQ